MKKTTRLETLDDLVQHALSMGVYDATRKYRLESRRTTDMVDPQDGTEYFWDSHITQGGVSQYRATLKDGVEVYKTEAELYQVQYNTYYLDERNGRSYSQSGYIHLSPQLGALIEKIWPTEQKPWLSQPTLKATQYTLAGILKRLGQTDIEKQVKQVIAERTAIQLKEKRNTARQWAIRNLGEATALVERSQKEIPLEEYVHALAAIKRAVEAVQGTIEE